MHLFILLLGLASLCGGLRPTTSPDSSVINSTTTNTTLENVTLSVSTEGWNKNNSHLENGTSPQIPVSPNQKPRKSSNKTLTVKRKTLKEVPHDGTNVKFLSIFIVCQVLIVALVFLILWYCLKKHCGFLRPHHHYIHQPVHFFVEMSEESGIGSAGTAEVELGSSMSLSDGNSEHETDGNDED